MILTKKSNKFARVAALSVMSFGLCFLSHSASAATNVYFDLNGTTTGSGVANNGTYTWGTTSVWSTSSAGTSATAAWASGEFPRFAAGTDAGADNYTVTENSSTTIAGMDLQTNGGGTVTINGSGSLTIAAGVQGFLIGSSTQDLVVDSKMIGSGGVEQETNGKLSLFGANTYSGGTVLTGGQDVYYNNNSSFGTAGITVQGGSIQALINAATVPVTIANAFTFNAATPGVILAGGTASASTNYTGKFPMTYTGTFGFDTNVAGQVTEISGVISGATPLNIFDAGTMILAGPNTYSGTTTVTSPATLKLGASGTIASTPEVILAGGTLNPDGFLQTMSLTTLDMTASATLDYGVGAAEMDFANSSALTWTGTLNLANFTLGVDFLRFDSGPTGLTSAQLAEIEFDGDPTTLGTAYLDQNGYVVPEPTTLSLLGLGAVGFMGRRRK